MLAKAAPETLAVEDSRGASPLYAACRAGHERVVAQLLKLVSAAELAGDSPPAYRLLRPRSDGATALHAACAAARGTHRIHK